MKNTVKTAWKIFIKFENRLLILFMTLLGISTSCEKIFNSQDEYGTPQADFIVNGKVVSVSTNDAIKNIQVIMQRDTAYTNDSGEFYVSVNDFPQANSYVLKVKDIDGNLNGNFEEQEITVDFTDDNFEGGDGNWYKGKQEKDINISLNEETE